MNRVKRAISLPLKSLDVAIEIYNKIIPNSFFPAVAESFDKKRLDLTLGCRRGKNDSSFGLYIKRFTLVRSLTVS
jgi:hypothetical protein